MGARLLNSGLVGAAVCVVGFVSTSGCRQNLACYGADECQGGQICLLGECVDPPVATVIDSGVSPDVGVDGGAVGQVTWLRDVEPIVRVRCQPCHASPPQNGAPFPLVTFSDTQAVQPGGQAVHQVMAARVQDPANPMPPRTELPLSDLEIRVIVEWSAQGAPQGTLVDAGPDAGFVDTGPDGGFVDSGFFDGGAGAGTDPLTPLPPFTQLPGFYSTLDGIAWSPMNEAVYFCDLSDNIIFEFDPVVGATGSFRANTLGASGIGFAPNGDLITAEQAGRRVVRDDNTGTAEAIANAFMNDRFNAPNDVEVRSDGVIYFTDPAINLVGRRELAFNGLFRLTTTGTVVVEWTGAQDTAPDGLALSPDERRLYMSDSATSIVRVFDVDADGDLTNERGFTVAGLSAAGMDVDRDGNLYVATEQGIDVFAPSGFKWGTLGVIGPPNNLVFGASDFSRLFVTTPNQVFFFEMNIPGVQRPSAVP